MIQKKYSSCFLLPFFIFWGANLPAQQISLDHIEFQSNPEWKKALTQARQSGKLIFFDGYTTWCGPCRKMEKEVFTMPEVANYFNQKFINVKYDMEKGEGIELKNQYDVSAFPTYLFIDGKGQVVHRIIGAYTNEGEFLTYAKMAVTPGQSYTDLEQRYRNGERNPDIMFSYMRVLRLAGEQKKKEALVKSYLSLMTKDHFMDSAYWGAVKLFLKDPFSREFNILLNNRNDIAAAIGVTEVDGKIYEVIDQGIKDINSASGAASSNGKSKEEDLLLLLRKADFPRRNELLARALATWHASQGNWYDYACTVDAMMDYRLLDGFDGALDELDSHARKVERLALDDALLKKALRWSEFTCDKALHAADKARFLKTKASLLEKLHLRPEAEAARQAARQAEKEQKKRE